jgi:hypothetical protein
LLELTFLKIAGFTVAQWSTSHRHTWRLRRAHPMPKLIPTF